MRIGIIYAKESRDFSATKILAASISQHKVIFNGSIDKLWMFKLDVTGKQCDSGNRAKTTTTRTRHCLRESCSRFLVPSGSRGVLVYNVVNRGIVQYDHTQSEVALLVTCTATEATVSRQVLVRWDAQRLRLQTSNANDCAARGAHSSFYLAMKRRLWRIWRADPIADFATSFNIGRNTRLAVFRFSHKKVKSYRRRYNRKTKDKTCWWSPMTGYTEYKYMH